MVKAPMSDPSGYSVSLTLTGAGSGSARSPLPKSTVVYLPAGSDGGPSGLHFGSGLTEVPPGGRHSKYVVVTDIGNRLAPGCNINGCELQPVVKAGSCWTVRLRMTTA